MFEKLQDRPGYLALERRSLLVEARRRRVAVAALTAAALMAAAPAVAGPVLSPGGVGMYHGHGGGSTIRL